MNNRVIEKALGYLITNASIAENYIIFRENIFSEYNFKLEDIKILDEFYDVNREKFTAASRILKKNRWDNVKKSIPIIVTYITSQKLDIVWENYLQSITLNQKVPKNPLLESLLFCDFAKDTEYFTMIEKNIINYEVMRNQVAKTYYQKDSQKIFLKKVQLNLLNVEKISGYIDDCYKIINFDFDITDLMNPSLKKYKNKLNNNKSRVLYFKNLNREGIGSLKISEDASEIIEKISKIKKLSQVFESLSNINKDSYIAFLTRLDQLGVICFYEGMEAAK